MCELPNGSSFGGVSCGLHGSMAYCQACPAKVENQPHSRPGCQNLWGSGCQQYSCSLELKRFNPSLRQVFRLFRRQEHFICLKTEKHKRVRRGVLSFYGTMKCRVHQNGCICLAKSGWGERQRHAPCSSLPILSVGFWPSVFIAWLFPTQCFLLVRQKMLMLRCANLSGTRFDCTSQSPKTCHDSSMHRRHAGQNYLFPNFSRTLFPSPMMIKQV